MRIWPDPVPGSHPIAPEPPSWHLSQLSPFSTLLTAAGACGLAAQVFKTLFRRPQPGFAIRTAATIAVVLLPIGIGVDGYADAVIRKGLEEEGVKIPKRKWFDRVGHVDQDDLFATGALSGLYTAFFQPHQYPMVLGWRRPLGLICLRGGIFTCLGQPLLWYLNRRTLADDLKKYSAAKEKAHSAERELLHKASLKKQSQVSALQWPTGSSGFPSQAAPANPFLNPDLLPDSAVSEYTRPGKGPHELYYDPLEQKVVSLPVTDYHWTPESNAEGQRALKEHIDDLLERRKKLVRHVEWLWHELAIRENNFYHLPPGDDKDITRRKLELLASFHKNLWVEISEIDWMIGDSRKQIFQLQAAEKGAKWLPPTTSANASFTADKTGTQPVDEGVWSRLMRDLHIHRHDLQAIIAQMDEVLVTEERNSEEKEHFDGALQHVKQNEDATYGLIREFEERGKK